MTNATFALIAFKLWLEVTVNCELIQWIKGETNFFRGREEERTEVEVNWEGKLLAKKSWLRTVNGVCSFAVVKKLTFSCSSKHLMLTYKETTGIGYGRLLYNFAQKGAAFYIMLNSLQLWIHGSLARNYYLFSQQLLVSPFSTT